MKASIEIEDDGDFVKISSYYNEGVYDPDNKSHSLIFHLMKLIKEDLKNKGYKDE